MSVTGGDILIGIDAGTSVIKSVAFSLAGAQLAVASVPNSYTTRPDGAAVQDMAQTWRDCAQTLRMLAGKLPGLAGRVAAISVTGQGDGTWLVGAENSPVTEAWLWLDGRAHDEVTRLRADPADPARFAATGSGLNACQMGTQLAHMQRHHPDWLAQTEVALHCKDWLYLNLTGIRATDPSEVGFTFGNFRHRAYDESVVEALGLSAQRHILPPVLDGVTTSHPLTEAAARDSGLLAGTPVCLGYVDVVCTAMGAGIYTPGALAGCTIVGSTGMHMRATAIADVTLNEARTGYVMILPVPGLVAQIQSNMAATLNIDWLLKLAAEMMAEFGHEVSQADLVGRIDGWLSASKPGQILYHPYISEAGERGPFVDGSARAGFAGLASAHRFGDLVRAVIEGLGYSAHDCYRAMSPIPAEIRLTGGAARSRGLRDIMAAAIGAPVRSSGREEAGAAGAAMIAACAIGVYDDMDACLRDWVEPQLGPAETPRPELQARYAHLFPAYLALREAAPPVWRRLASNPLERLE
ncbi:MAG: carbohydrate kinase [Natronohydrobacter sp.]|nr:carbohydrate kinase [Natronohydrobacter sp.]